MIVKICLVLDAMVKLRELFKINAPPITALNVRTSRLLNTLSSTCATNSEPYALQNIGDMMSPEFSENCIIIVDPSMPIHHKAYVISRL